MINIKVYYNDTVRSFDFYNLLDGMMWLESHVMIDYIIIDDVTRVTWDEWDTYVDRLKNFCKEVYGTY